MTTSEGLKWLYDKAIQHGYSDYQIRPYVHEIKEQIEKLDDWDEETLNCLFNKLF